MEHFINNSLIKPVETTCGLLIILVCDFDKLLAVRVAITLINFRQYCSTVHKTVFVSKIYYEDNEHATETIIACAQLL